MNGKDTAPNEASRDNKSSQLFTQGLDNYQRGDFHSAVPLFQQSINSSSQTHPDRLKYESFYGMTLIRLNYKHIGLEKCRIAAKIESDDSDILLNLAEAEFITGNRLASLQALKNLKAINPEHLGARELRKRMGKRHKFPVIPFLSRDNALNIALGKWLYKNRISQN